MRRPRGPGGRFLTGDEIRALEQQEATGSRNGANGSAGEPESAAPIPEPVET
jgi:hypothetical protein